MPTRALKRPSVGSKTALFSLILVASLLSGGCSPRPPVQPPVQPAAPVTKTPESRIDRYSLALVVHKSQGTLSVYRRGTIVEQYPAVFGQRAVGDKLYEGDLRTPEGLYRITRKKDHPRWRHFLEIDYPNESDRIRYERNLEQGRIPVIRNKVLAIGGGIGIHGSDRPKAQRSRTNWTRGCIALNNHDIDEVFELVKVGTPVLVLP